MSIEIATGEEARSVRRWIRRVVVPILVRSSILLVLVVLAVVGFWLVWDIAFSRPYLCPGLCIPQPHPSGLLDLIF